MAVRDDGGAGRRERADGGDSGGGVRVRREEGREGKKEGGAKVEDGVRGRTG